MKNEGYQKFSNICFSILVPILSLLISLYLLVAVLASFLDVSQIHQMSAMALTFLPFAIWGVVGIHLEVIFKKNILLKMLINELCNLDMSFLYILVLLFVDVLLLHNGIAFVVDWWNR